MSPTTVTGSPKTAFAQAFYLALAADAILLTLVTGGVMTAVRRDVRVSYPYLIVGRRDLRDHGAGAMQREGGTVHLFVDVWSAANDPIEVEQIQSRVRALMTRNDLAVSGFALYAGSVTCPEELVFTEPDPDLPERSLFHGVQQWTGLLEEAL